MNIDITNIGFNRSKLMEGVVKSITDEFTNRMKANKFDKVEVHGIVFFGDIAYIVYSAVDSMDHPMKYNIALHKYTNILYPFDVTSFSYIDYMNEMDALTTIKQMVCSWKIDISLTDIRRELKKELKNKSDCLNNERYGLLRVAIDSLKYYINSTPTSEKQHDKPI